MTVAFRMKGFLEARDADTDLLWGLGCEGLWQDGEDIVAYFAAPLELPFVGVWEQLEPQDYIERYYAELQPVYLQTLVVAPTHSAVTVTGGQKVLWLDPGMAFGTGHHETTRLALRELERLELADKHVLDVGAGSGILAIAADLLGAASAHGLDTDPDTLPVAEANRRLNRSRATFAPGSLQDAPGRSADVLVANLFAELHLELCGEYRRVLKPGGSLVISGILHDKLPAVEAALTERFEVGAVVTDGEWALLTATPTGTGAVGKE